jgi:hypothetical protein
MEWLTRHPLYDIRDRMMSKLAESGSLVDTQTSDSVANQVVEEKCSAQEVLGMDLRLLGKYLYLLAKQHQLLQEQAKQGDEETDVPESPSRRDPIGYLLLRTFFADAISAWDGAYLQYTRSHAASAAPSAFLQCDQFRQYHFDYQDAMKMIQTLQPRPKSPASDFGAGKAREVLPGKNDLKSTDDSKSVVKVKVKVPKRSVIGRLLGVGKVSK